MRAARLSLFAKLTALALAAAALTIGAFALAGQAVLDDLHDRHEGRLRGMTRLVIDAILHDPSPEKLARVAAELQVDIRYEGEGVVYASRPDMPSFDELRRAQPPRRRWRNRYNGGEEYGRKREEREREEREYEDDHDDHDYEEREYAGRRHGRRGRLPRAFSFAQDAGGNFYLLYHEGGRRAAISLASEDDLDSVPLALAALAAALALIWGGVYAALRRQLAPLAALRQDMEAVGAGEWREFESARQDEIGQLGRGFNDMQRRLRDLLAARERFLIAASHELRSPIARLKLAAEMIEDDKARRSLSADLAELEALTGDILQNARLRSPHAGLQLRRVAAGAWLEGVLAARPAAERGRIARVFDGAAAGMELEIDAALLARAVGNLLDNALKYAERAELRLALVEDGGGAGAGADGRRRVQIVVRDDGAGVAAADLPRLFEPFYRADESRTRGTGGFGLGLAIAAAAVAAHGGRIVAANCAAGGLEVAIVL